MSWNWQHANWPDFSWKSEALAEFEQAFLLQAGELVGAYKHVTADERETLRIELLSEEALKTSEIEGEFLNRASVQASLRHQFGLGPERPGIAPAERGVAEMMVDLYQSFATPLTDATLFTWHRMLLSGEMKLSVIGGWRTHDEPMQVVSGPDYRRNIHFEAPPSARMPREMACFISWFNETGPTGRHPLPALTRAGIAHLYFVCIHPFEDGNGRIGRAIAEKALAENLGQPSLIALAYTIERKRKEYYAALESNNKGLEITAWLTYFARTILEAQRNTIERVDFAVLKARYYQRLHGALNERQAKAIGRMFREGLDGFKGGLSAANYIAITGTSRASATRDLQDLIEKGALIRSGELRHARYHLNLRADFLTSATQARP